ncbi:MAG TPA: hypothetical protein VMW16_03080 [Sedimentisphaerales bacterium]|nr:hypothetical protein [Sedimentisphaerales bacterium]
MGLGYSNEGPITGPAGEDLEADRLVRISAGKFVYCDAAEEPVGITLNAVLSGAKVAVHPINAGGIAKVTGSKDIAAGAAIYPATDGKVSDAAGGGRRIGTLWLDAITADGGKAAALINIFSGDALLHDTSVHRFREDFHTGCTEDGHKFSETADKGDWLKSSTDGEPDSADVCNVADDGPSGILQLTCNDANADNENVQLNGESFKLAVGKPLWFETKVALLDIDKCDFFIGLAIADVDILGGVLDRVGFENLHDGNIAALIEQDETEYNADTTSDIGDCAAIANFAATAVKLAFYWDGVDTVNFFVDGVLKKSFTDNATTILVPDDEALSPVFQIKTHTGAAAVQTAWIDYIDIVAVR